MSAPAIVEDEDSAINEENPGSEASYTSEGFLASCQHNGTRIVVIVEAFERVVQFYKEGSREGVQGSGAIQRDWNMATVSVSVRKAQVAWERWEPYSDRPQVWETPRGYSHTWRRPRPSKVESGG